jgi:phosphatidylserine decarboxylase
MISRVIPKESRIIFGAFAVLSVALWVTVFAGGNEIIIAIAVLVTLAFGFILFFFRDPERVVPAGDDNIVSPCDGRVIEVKPISEDVLGEPGKRISIFMTAFNVHVNRNVCSGIVVEVEHRAGRFGHAGKDRAARENEQNRIVIEHSGFRIMVTQVAGVLARRIICRLAPGDDIKKGERFGMIVLGSRLMVALPDAITICVKEGQRVRAGETIIGVINS